MLDQFGEIGKRPYQPVGLVDHDDVDLSRPHLFHEGLQGRTIERGSRKGVVVEPVRNERPALMRLVLDIGLAGFPPSIEGVEGEVEIVNGRECDCGEIELERKHRPRTRRPE